MRIFMITNDTSFPFAMVVKQHDLELLILVKKVN